MPAAPAPAVTELAKPTPADEAAAIAICRAFFYDPRVDSVNPHVEVTNGVATLTGRVDNQVERQATLNSAYAAGAKKVRDDLQLPSSELEAETPVLAPTGRPRE